MSIPKATHSGILKIGDKEIQCSVLENGTRVISQRGFQKSIGMSSSGGTGGAHRMARFVTKLEEKGIKIKDLSERINNPIIFQPKSGASAYGYEAIILPEICEFILQCRDAKKLTAAQQHIAVECDIIMRAFARVGIIALVDEVTGYQAVRSRQALEEILEKFISKELRKWAKTFPDEFYEQMFRLRDWQYQPFSVKRPQYVGTLTNDIVYERLAPGVLDELKRLTPRDEKGRTKQRFFQRLTEDVGHPRLREHLTAVIALMRASTKWEQFYRMLQRALPRYMEQQPLGIDEQEDE
ncbi:MAG: P63C domain-containing protein [Smithella sp.]|jgi:hypothetical protein